MTDTWLRPMTADETNWTLISSTLRPWNAAYQRFTIAHGTSMDCLHTITLDVEGSLTCRDKYAIVGQLASALRTGLSLRNDQIGAKGKHEPACCNAQSTKKFIGGSRRGNSYEVDSSNRDQVWVHGGLNEERSAHTCNPVAPEHRSPWKFCPCTRCPLYHVRTIAGLSFFSHKKTLTGSGLFVLTDDGI